VRAVIGNLYADNKNSISRVHFLSAMLLVATTFKLLAEIALLAMAGQWILGRLAGEGKSTNPFYQALQLVGKPWMLSARWLSPQRVPDRYLPLVAVFLAGSIWLLATVGKVSICLKIGVALCR
jgi:hypothetical protein